MRQAPPNQTVPKLIFKALGLLPIPKPDTLLNHTCGDGSSWISLSLTIVKQFDNGPLPGRANDSGTDPARLSNGLTLTPFPPDVRFDVFLILRLLSLQLSRVPLTFGDLHFFGRTEADSESALQRSAGQPRARLPIGRPGATPQEKRGDRPAHGPRL